MVAKIQKVWRRTIDGRAIDRSMNHAHYDEEKNRNGTENQTEFTMMLLQLDKNQANAKRQHAFLETIQ